MREIEGKGTDKLREAIAYFEGERRHRHDIEALNALRIVLASQSAESANVHVILRPIRGCATDEQYQEASRRVEAALTAAALWRQAPAPAPRRFRNQLEQVERALTRAYHLAPLDEFKIAHATIRAALADSGEIDRWQCGVRKQGTAGGNNPIDCNWPFCGCDPAANKVMDALEEAGYRPPYVAGERT